MENGTSPALLSEVTGPKLDIPVPILHDLITSSVATHGDKAAIICKHQPADQLPAVSSYRRPALSAKRVSYLQWTHAQLQYGADLLAHALTKRGVQPHSTIAVILSGRAEFHMILRAAVKLKCPFTPINLNSPRNAKEIRHMLNLSNTKVLIVEDAAIVKSLEENVPDLMQEMQLKVVTGGIPALDPYLSLNDLISDAAGDNTFEAQNRALEGIPRSVDDVVLFWFTSGTTSLPKAAPHTNMSLMTNIRSWTEAFKLDDQRAWLHALPMNSIVGSSWTLTYLLPGGSVTHCNFNFDPLSIAETVCTGECTDVLLVPTMVELLAGTPTLDSADNKGIAHVILGGSKILRSHVEKSFKYLKCNSCSPFFGMTEGSSVCHETYYRVPEDPQAPIYSGYINPGAKVRICAPDGIVPLPRGEAGEIVQGGWQKIERYLGGQGKDSFFTDAGETWFRTGDQAIMAEDGRIAIVGRYKADPTMDMIIRGGMNIAATAVEAVIAEGTGLDAQVIGIPDEVAGEVPVAVIKTSKYDGVATTDVQRCVLDRLGRAYALERVLHLQDLGAKDWPKTTSGKVLKTDLRKLALDLIEQEREHSKQVNGGTVTQRNGHSRLSEDEVQKYLLAHVQASGIPISNIDDDFHNAGMDSLLAMQLRNAIVKNPDIGVHIPLSQNVVFEAGNVRDLSAQLMSLNSRHDQPSDIPEKMAAMVERYSQFQKRGRRGKSTPDMHTILLTGTTGSLGAHLLAQLVQRSDVRTVYCPVRGEDPVQRVEAALRDRSIFQAAYAEKVKVVAFDVAKPGFGLDGDTLEALQSNLTLIVHAAWPVNFQLSLASFEPHIHGLHSLIQLCLDVKSQRPARLLFCSSMGVALSTQGQRRITEEPIMDFRQGSSSGYTQSKLVAEYIVQTAVEDYGAAACNLRIGQIVGDTKLGLWNESEAPPLMIRSALTLRKLPALDMSCSWIPVDTMAAAIIELATLPPETNPRLVYNLCNPRPFSWTHDLLPTLAATGLEFDTSSFDKWLSDLKSYDASHSTQVAIAECPAVKLIDFYESTYGKTQQDRAVEFDTRAAQRDSPSITNAPDVIKSGIVATMLHAWMKKWDPDLKLVKQKEGRKRSSSSSTNGQRASRLRSR